MRTNIFKRLLSVMLLIVIFATQSAWAEVSGSWQDNRAQSLKISSTGDTVFISSAAELAYYAYLVNNGSNTPTGIYYGSITVELQADIDLSAHYWQPIAYYDDTRIHFDGTFHGNNHVISGLTIESYTLYSSGLFGVVQQSSGAGHEICDVILKDCKVSGKSNQLSASYGGLIGRFDAIDSGQQYSISNVLLIYPQIRKDTNNWNNGTLIGNYHGNYNYSLINFSRCYVYFPKAILDKIDYNAEITGMFVGQANKKFSGYKYARKITFTDESMRPELTSETGLVCKNEIYAAEGEEIVFSVKDADGNLCDDCRVGDDDLTSTNDYYTYTMGAEDQTAFAGKIGSKSYPYMISNVAELVAFRDVVNGGFQNAYARLVADIDLSTLEGNWIPIGTQDSPFMGSFDGDGHSITNMKILNFTTGNQGFFGRVAGTHPSGHAQLKNFSVSGTMTSSTSGLAHIAGVVGFCDYVADLDDITNKVNITLTEGTTQSHIGGVAGYCSRTNMQRCVNNGNIDAGASWECIGGLQGYTRGYSAMKYCLNTGNLTTTADNAYIGGILGYQNDYKFSGCHNCLNTGAANGGTANTYAGAIYGWYRAAANIKSTNNYYLSTSATKAVGANETTDDLTGVCTAVTNKQIVYGETCYKLNGSTSEGTLNWYQKLGENYTPVPVVVADGTVYRRNYCDGSGLSDEYGNAATDVAHKFDETKDPNRTVCTNTTSCKHTFIRYTAPSKLDLTSFYRSNQGWENKSNQTFVLGEGVIEFGVTLKTLGKYSFKGCSELTSIMLPTTVTSIGLGAFSGLQKLTKVSSLENVEEVGNEAFHNCGIAGTVNLSSATTVGESAFKNCGNITDVVWNKDLKLISSYAFYLCTNLKNFSSFENIEEIGICAFVYSGISGTVNLSSATRIGNTAFYKCGITNVVFGENIEYIGETAFADCSNLSGVVTLPAKFKELGGSAFENCKKLSKVILHSIPQQESNAFPCASHYVLDDNSYVYYNAQTSYATSATYTRNVKNDWEVIFLPFNAQLTGDDYTIYVLEKVSDSEIVFDRTARILPPGFMGLLHRRKNVSEITIHSYESIDGGDHIVNTDATYSSVRYYVNGINKGYLKVQGTFSGMTYTDGGYVFDGNKFVEITENQKIPPFRWFIPQEVDSWDTITLPVVCPPGDINCDGERSVVDLSLLVRLLNGEQIDYIGDSDVNGENGTTIDDVDALENILLNRAVK